MQGKVLVADSDKKTREKLRYILEDEGYDVVSAISGEEVLREFENFRFDILLTDVGLPGIGGVEVLKKLQKLSRTNTATIILTSHDTLDYAIKAMKLGAFDYILKPFNSEELVETVKKAYRFILLERENISLKETMSLYKLSEISISSLNLDTIIDTVLRTLKTETNADVVCLQLEEGYSNDGKSFVEKSGSCFSEQCSTGCIFDKDKLLPYLKMGQPVILSQREVLKTLAIDCAVAIKSAIIVPLNSATRNFGYILIPSFEKVFSEGERKVVTIIASQAISAFENAYLHNNLQKSFREAIQGLIYALEAKEKYTAGHSIRVGYYTKMFTEYLDITSKEKDDIFQAALLHDIGKIGIRMNALNYPGKLSKEEYEVFKIHPEFGKKILEPISFLMNVVPYIYHHHERYDGTGYPKGLKGEKIPYGARVLAIIDSYDVMTSDRPYRKRLQTSEVLKEFEKCAGKQFDPKLVKIFLKVLSKHSKEFEHIHANEFFINIRKQHTYYSHLLDPDLKLFINDHV